VFGRRPPRNKGVTNKKPKVNGFPEGMSKKKLIAGLAPFKVDVTKELDPLGENNP